MKKQALFLLVLVGVLSACDQTEVTPQKGCDTTEKTIEMKNYDAIVFANRELLSDWAYEVQDAQTTGTRSVELNSVKYDSLKHNLLPSARQFAAELGITKADIETSTGVEISNQQEMDETLVGLLLFATVTDCSIIEDSQTRGGSFKDCFMEATGIAGGIALVAGLSKGVVSKAVVMTTLKLAARVGTKTLNAVGLGLLAAEITWCMW